MRDYLDSKVLDNLMEGFQLISFEWRYIYVNDVVVKQGKSTKEELLGKTMMEKYPGIEKTKMFKTLQFCMKNRVSKQMENEFTYPDGTTAWFQLNIEPVPEGLFILSLDISDRKKIVKELTSLIKEQKKKSKSNKEFDSILTTCNLL